MPVFALSEDLVFPPVELADPSGVIAVGGDLTVARLMLAYRSGIFPWYGEDEPIIWWSPDPRFVLFPDRLKVSASLGRTVKSGKFTVSEDSDFRSVITACREMSRPGQDGTWITEEMLEAYCLLHEQGYAHSIEVWEHGELVGGLYGVDTGRCFSGESMFARVSDASKVGLVHLARKLEREGYRAIDCQQKTRHLESFGGVEIPRSEFLELLVNEE